MCQAVSRHLLARKRGSIRVLRLYSGSIKARLRLFQGTCLLASEAVLRALQGSLHYLKQDSRA